VDVNEERRARNLEVIEEFRANGGVLPGSLPALTLLLLHHVGAKSGAEYVTPLAYLEDGDRWVLFAANGGRPNNPGWYYNLLAKPETVIEVGTETHRVAVRVLHGSERADLVARQKQVTPFLGRFEEMREQEIPVLALERVQE
jgi:deazaflavin-dependent oxidoreductase (nitroreductase family)